MNVKRTLSKGIKIGCSRLSLPLLFPPLLQLRRLHDHATKNCQQKKPVCNVLSNAKRMQNEDGVSDSHQCPNCIKKWEASNEYEPLDNNHKAGDKIKCDIYIRVAKQMYEKFLSIKMRIKQGLSNFAQGWDTCKKCQIALEWGIIEFLKQFKYLGVTLQVTRLCFTLRASVDPLIRPCNFVKNTKKLPYLAHKSSGLVKNLGV